MLAEAKKVTRSYLLYASCYTKWDTFSKGILTFDRDKIFLRFFSFINYLLSKKGGLNKGKKNSFFEVVRKSSCKAKIYLVITNVLTHVNKQFSILTMYQYVLSNVESKQRADSKKRNHHRPTLLFFTVVLVSNIHSR